MNRNLGLTIFSASTAFILIAFGFIGDKTRWLHRKSLTCFDAKALSSRPNNSLVKLKQSCITHIIRPYASKQGSVILDISNTLEDGRTLSYRTIFWMAKDIGKDRFSDVPGDFTTIYFQVYDTYGISKLKVQDTSSGWQSAGSTPDRFIELCPSMPILLNKLHFQKSCRETQVSLWKDIFNSPIIANREYYRPIDDSFIAAVINHPFLSLFTILLAATASLAIQKKGLRYWFNFLKIADFRTKRLFLNILLLISQTSPRVFISQYRRHAFIPTIAIVAMTLGLIASRTNLFTAKHISCKRHELGAIHAQRKLRPAFFDYSSLNICLDEIIVPYDSWFGIVNVVITVYDQTGRSIKADAIFFVKDATVFSDASGDIMYQSLSYYNKNGLLTSRNYEITSEHYEDLMPAAASHALWRDVKDKTARLADTKYLSPSRMLYLVATDSLPLMIAGGLLIYSYGLSLSVMLNLKSK
jgi:hypothetical protein